MSRHSVLLQSQPGQAAPEVRTPAPTPPDSRQPVPRDRIRPIVPIVPSLPAPEEAERPSTRRARPREREAIPAAPGLALFVAVFALVLWAILGEPWEIGGDAALYLRMSAGEAVQAPFGHRILAPWLVSLAPMEPRLAFALLSWSSLAGAALALFVYARTSVRQGGTARVGWIALGFLVCSYAFAYYGTALVRVDPPALALLVLALALAAQGRPTWLVAVILVPATLAHETTLVLLPILVLDRALGARLLGDRRLTWAELALIAAAGLAAFVGCRALTPVIAVEAQISYLTTPSAILAHVLQYSGGALRHVQRVYAAYGPVLVYALLAGVLGARGRARLFVPAVLSVGVVLTLLATDTLRVMAVIFPVVLLYGARFVAEAWRRQGALLAGGLVAAQGAYAWLVFGHLRTFEGSARLQLGAIGVSGIAVLLSAVAAWPLLRGVALWGKRGGSSLLSGAAATLSSPRPGRIEP